MVPGWAGDVRQKTNLRASAHFSRRQFARPANGGDGWDVLNRKKAFIRHVAAVICRENSRMICSATRMRPAGSRVVARGRSPGERA
eukprot:scaffold17657_cov131-Isochrysis_galbana.AAC.7